MKILRCDMKESLLGSVAHVYMNMHKRTEIITDCFDFLPQPNLLLYPQRITWGNAFLRVAKLNNNFLKAS